MGSLDLSDNTFESDQGLATLFAGLQNHARLKELQLDKCLLKSSLGGALMKTKSTPMDAATNTSPGNTNMIFTFLTRSADLKSLFTIPNLLFLSLAENNLRQGVRDLLPLYSETSQPTITRLNLRSNNLGDRGAAVIARILSVNPSVEEINIEENGLTITGWSSIANAMSRYARWTVLGFSKRNF